MKKEIKEKRCYICGEEQNKKDVSNFYVLRNVMDWYILGDRLLCKKCLNNLLNFVVNLYKVNYEPRNLGKRIY